MLREQLKQKIKEQKALVDKAVAENRGMTDEEQATFDTLEAEIKNLEKTIEAQEAIEARAVATNEPVNEPIWAEPKSQKADKPFNTFGDQLNAIVASSKPGESIDNRLMAVQNAASGANEGVPSDGGFLVQQDFSKEIVKNVYDTGILAPLCKKIPISSNSNGVKINGVDESNRGDGYRWGGVQGYWASEAGTVTATKPKFRQLDLSLNKLMVIGYATDELLQDTAALGAVMEEAFADEIKFKLDDGIFRGDGSGKMLGFMNSGALVSQAKETGQAAATIVANNIVKMYSRMPARSRKTAVWLINQEIEPQLFMLKFDDDRPVYMPPNGLAGEPYGTILGRPVVPVEHASALGTAGDINFVDLSRYLIADKAKAKSDVSMHVRFLYDEMAFRVTYRVDGQPVISKAITPYKGAATLSPFVTLATRA